MSTVEDFENAPVGATATGPRDRTARKTDDPVWPWRVSVPDGFVNDYTSSRMVNDGFTLDPTTDDPAAAPATAREALDLVWNLAHPVKARQVIPEGTACLYRLDDGYQIHKTPEGMIARESWTDIRTLDPLPDPEPDWLDAPAVLAATIFEDRSVVRSVFVRENKDGTQWVRDTRFYRWDELIDVVPLYPKEQDA